ncbi:MULTISPECIES: DUF421 domain-containing protein [Bacillus]|uniref:DUF421 domain-containing protein n=1 Tax=Bacillus pumilus TaxID=1408 RepID=A0A2G8IQP8_BACPU|nr:MULTISPECIES: DUF421 domain-containing protein [Bacillus]MCC9087318.1 DUF421 domain-containing protein [Bacillus pumilus]MED1749212.1 DUF421 domain-containing protein [Bacillus zhangzhouensis]PIK25794.1 DUF421 domain-containing protein [Bacillus pumilus]UUD44325.1 DUF421 domain-containing protein [Bacillus pumilus]
METLIDILKVYVRIITIIPWLLIVTLFMGKRAIGEVPVFDFLIIIVLGAVAGADIADPDIPHLYTFLSILAIGVLQIIVSKLKLKNRFLGRLITFEPTIVIRNGAFIVGNLQKIRYSLDNVLQMLREKDIFDVNDVELALIEPNGKLTAFKKPHKSTITAEDLGVKKVSGNIAYPVIIEGNIENQVLTQLNLTEQWLVQELQKKDLKTVDIFFASVNANHELHVSLNSNNKSFKPEINH